MHKGGKEHAIWASSTKAQVKGCQSLGSTLVSAPPTLMTHGYRSGPPLEVSIPS